MADRPALDKHLSGDDFRNYYYLKEELLLFCKKEGLQTNGGKADLTDRIAHYLDTGEKLTAKISRKALTDVGEITRDTLIECDFICSEKHRAFFARSIGKGFSFNVLFQKWLKANAGKTYEDAIKAFYEIKAERKTEKPSIDKQFEYNTYVRDFFADNKGKALSEAIACWNYKKGLPGHNRYEKADLAALE